MLRPCHPILMTACSALVAVTGCREAVISPAALTTLSAAASVTEQSGDGQVRFVGGRLVPFVIGVSDGGVPVANASVNWVVVSGSASLRRVSNTTNSDGEASATAIVPASVQTIIVEARVSGAGTASFGARITDGSDIMLDTIASGFDRPLYLTAPAGDARLFIVQEDGLVRIIKNGSVLPTPFLDLRAKISDVGEGGLLSLAFHPDYQTNGFFFVNYTDVNGDTCIERYFATPGSDMADASSAKLIITIPSPAHSNHNGGHMLFGPGRLLYIPMGDGGGANDPHGNGQNLNTLLGKLLRINPNVARAYAIPRDNPHVGQPDTRPEIWASGLRNPWRFAIDNGTLYIGDVGQAAREEVNVASIRVGGLNYGWSVMEGSLCRTTPCDPSGFTLPAVEYDHSQGCSVIAGFVYRGTELPELTGHYFYSDYCGGWIRSLRYAKGQITQMKEWTQFPTIPSVNSFGVDGAGELYVLSRTGLILRFRRQT